MLVKASESISTKGPGVRVSVMADIGSEVAPNVADRLPGIPLISHVLLSEYPGSSIETTYRTCASLFSVASPCDYRHAYCQAKKGFRQ